MKFLEGHDTHELAKSAMSDTHSSTPPGMSAFVLLIYNRPESLDPSQIISETLLSFVRGVVFPLAKSIKSHEEDEACVSKEYCEEENRATSYGQSVQCPIKLQLRQLTPDGFGTALLRRGAVINCLIKVSNHPDN